MMAHSIDGTSTASSFDLRLNSNEWCEMRNTESRCLLNFARAAGVQEAPYSRARFTNHHTSRGVMALLRQPIRARSLTSGQLRVFNLRATANTVEEREITRRGLKRGHWALCVTTAQAQNRPAPGAAYYDADGTIAVDRRGSGRDGLGTGGSSRPTHLMGEPLSEGDVVGALVDADSVHFFRNNKFQGTLRPRCARPWRFAWFTTMHASEAGVVNVPLELPVGIMRHAGAPRQRHRKPERWMAPTRLSRKPARDKRKEARRRRRRRCGEQGRVDDVFVANEMLREPFRPMGGKVDFDALRSTVRESYNRHVKIHRQRQRSGVSTSLSAQPVSAHPLLRHHQTSVASSPRVNGCHANNSITKQHPVRVSNVVEQLDEELPFFTLADSARIAEAFDLGLNSNCWSERRNINSQCYIQFQRVVLRCARPATSAAYVASSMAALRSRPEQMSPGGDHAATNRESRTGKRLMARARYVNPFTCRSVMAMLDTPIESGSQCSVQLAVERKRVRGLDNQQRRGPGYWALCVTSSEPQNHPCRGAAYYDENGTIAINNREPSLAMRVSSDVQAAAQRISATGSPSEQSIDLHAASFKTGEPFVRGDLVGAIVDENAVHFFRNGVHQATIFPRCSRPWRFAWLTSHHLSQARVVPNPIAVRCEEVLPHFMHGGQGWVQRLHSHSSCTNALEDDAENGFFEEFTDVPLGDSWGEELLDGLAVIVSVQFSDSGPDAAEAKLRFRELVTELNAEFKSGLVYVGRSQRSVGSETSRSFEIYTQVYFRQVLEVDETLLHSRIAGDGDARGWPLHVDIADRICELLDIVLTARRQTMLVGSIGGSGARVARRMRDRLSLGVRPAKEHFAEYSRFSGQGSSPSSFNQPVGGTLDRTGRTWSGGRLRILAARGIALNPPAAQELRFSLLPWGSHASTGLASAASSPPQWGDHDAKSERTVASMRLPTPPNAEDRVSLQVEVWGRSQGAGPIAWGKCELSSLVQVDGVEVEGDPANLLQNLVFTNDLIVGHGASYDGPRLFEVAVELSFPFVDERDGVAETSTPWPNSLNDKEAPASTGNWMIRAGLPSNHSDAFLGQGTLNETQAARLRVEIEAPMVHFTTGDRVEYRLDGDVDTNLGSHRTARGTIAEIVAASVSDGRAAPSIGYFDPKADCSYMVLCDDGSHRVLPRSNLRWLRELHSTPRTRQGIDGVSQSIKPIQSLVSTTRDPSCLWNWWLELHDDIIDGESGGAFEGLRVVTTVGAVGTAFRIRVDTEAWSVERRSSGDVFGEIEWTLESCDPSLPMHHRIGQRACEHVRGTYTPSDRRLTLQGYAETGAPGLVKLSEYKLDLVDGGANLVADDCTLKLVRMPVRYIAGRVSSALHTTKSWLGSRMLAPTSDGKMAGCVVVGHGEQDGMVKVVFDSSDGRTVTVARADCKLVPTAVMQLED